MRICCLTALILITGFCAAMEITTDKLSWQVGDITAQGYLAQPVDPEGFDKPGVLVFPEWWGINDYSRGRADELARLGFVALVVDMYGDGQSTEDPEQAGAWAKPLYADPQLMLERARAGLQALQGVDGVDDRRLGAIGFCFGGTTGLQLARSGAALKAVVSLHGGLKTQTPAEKGDVRAAILVCHGGADPLVPSSEVADFIDEMEQAKARYRLLVLSGVKHAFTNPAADRYAEQLPVGYDLRATSVAMGQTHAWLFEFLAPPRE